MKVILNLVTLYVCALQRFTAKFELKSKLMNPANKKVLYNTFFSLKGIRIIACKSWYEFKRLGFKSTVLRSLELRYARLKSMRLRCLGEKFRVEKSRVEMSWVEMSVFEMSWVEKFWVEKCRVYVQRGSRVE